MTHLEQGTDTRVIHLQDSMHTTPNIAQATFAPILFRRGAGSAEWRSRHHNFLSCGYLDGLLHSQRQAAAC